MVVVLAVDKHTMANYSQYHSSCYHTDVLDGLVELQNCN